MVARRPKLLAAGLVLATGVALAWPLRRDEPLPSSRRPVASTSTKLTAKPFAAAPRDATKPALDNTLSGTMLPLAPPDPDPFANVTQPDTAGAKSQPQVFSTISSSGVDVPPETIAEPSTQRIHVVHGGDSLDRLARRYLGDETRALEIFDLNREVLENPHILPLGTELKIPSSPAAGSE